MMYVARRYLFRTGPELGFEGALIEKVSAIFGAECVSKYRAAEGLGQHATFVRGNTGCITIYAVGDRGKLFLELKIEEADEEKHDAEHWAEAGMTALAVWLREHLGADSGATDDDALRFQTT